jgi:sulfide:quinone oxidoreductase
MVTRSPAHTVLSVPSRLQHSAGGPHRTLVVGGGVAGLEALIALRTFAGERLELELISPERHFAYRPMTVAAAFGPRPLDTLEIERVARTVRATCTIDSMKAVDPAENMITLASGEQRPYDFLLVAPGASTEEAIPGAITFGAPGGLTRFRKVLAAAERGQLAHLVFAVPGESGWPLALYELAMLTAQRLRRARVRAAISLLTPEPAPLSVFGGRASGAVLEDLEELGIHFIAGLYPEELAWGELRARPGQIRIQADAVITLPRLLGPRTPGLPSDERGFIPVDSSGLVRGMSDVYAAGDATTFPVKHGAVAAQQADAAAMAIAARVGAVLAPTAFRPVLRGVLLTSGAPRYLESAIVGGSGEQGVSSESPLWWPPAKIAARHLAPYLSGQVTGEPTPPRGVPVELDYEEALSA